MNSKGISIELKVQWLFSGYVQQAHEKTGKKMLHFMEFFFMLTKAEKKKYSQTTI